MANLTLMRARFPVAVEGTFFANPEGLMTPDPKETAKTAGGNPSTVRLDLGAEYAIDQIFVGFVSSAQASQYPGGAAVDVATHTSLAGAGTVGRGAATLGPLGSSPRHAFLKLGSPVTSRYWSIGVSNDVDPSGFTFGIAAFGLAVQPVWGHEWGSGRFVRDMSSVAALRGGGFSVERGAVVPGWQFTCGDLTDSEVNDLWDMVREVGESSPVLVVEDPDPAGGATSFTAVANTANTSPVASGDGWHTITKSGGAYGWDATARGVRIFTGDFVVHARTTSNTDCVVGVNVNPGSGTAFGMTLGVYMQGAGRQAYDANGNAISDFFATYGGDAWVWRVGGTIKAGLGASLTEAMGSVIATVSSTAPVGLEVDIRTVGSSVMARAWEPEALTKRLHYGLLDRPEAYMREAPGANRWSFRVKEWW